MRFEIVILLLIAAVPAIWFLGPVVSIGGSVPLGSAWMRIALIALCLAGAGAVLAKILLARFWKAPVDAPANSYRSTWLAVGLLGLPVIVFAGLAIYLIETAYQRVSETTLLVQETIEDLKATATEQTFGNLVETNLMLTRVRHMNPGGAVDIAMPLLDPSTDREYLDAQYTWMVNNHLRPHFLRILEEQIVSNLNAENAPDLYETLKVYLMLGQLGPLDRDVVIAWIETDLEQRFPGSLNAGLRDEINQHVDAMLRSDLWSDYELDPVLVEEAQRVLSTVPIARLLYSRSLNDPAAATLPAWRVSDNAGPNAARVLTRASGVPLSQGVPGIFTRNGFYEVFLPLALSSEEIYLSEGWVLGLFGEDSAASSLNENVLELYYRDYQAEWDRVLEDLVIAPINSRDQLSDTLNILSNPAASPLYLLLRNVSREVSLGEDPMAQDRDMQTDLAAAAALRSLSSRQARLLQLLSSEQVSAALVEAPGRPVEDHFAELRAFTTRRSDGLWPLDHYTDRLGDLSRAWQAAMGAPGSATDTELRAALLALDSAARDAPTSVERWTQQIVGAFQQESEASAIAQLNASWRAEALPFCVRATTGRYPVDPGSREEMSLADFARLFGPGGVMDTFFNERLASMVDRSGRDWTWRDGVDFSPTALRQFQRAADIRAAFFAQGRELSVPFTLHTIALDPNASGGRMDIHGQSIDLSRFAAMSSQVEWPGPAPNVEISLGGPGGTSRMFFGGHWAWFRLLDDGGVRLQPQPDRVRIVKRIEGLALVQEMEVSSTVNPFTTKALRDFRCPNGF